MESAKAQTVLEGMGVAGWPGVYVLGCMDRRVTVYSQQVRALNLAAALIATKRLKPGDSAVVIGAGAAGLTCAAGLLRLGAKVTVLEAQDDILPLFRGGSMRWLHPGVYDWPLPGWDRDRAGLPLLDWKHGIVHSVRAEMEVGWSKVVGQKKNVVRLKVNRVRFGNAGDELRTVTWNPGGAQRTNTVILAVGFGLEPAPLSSERRYWEHDDFDAMRIDGMPRRWLVSGCGDGALTDLLRLCLKNFQHDRMLQDFVCNPRMQEICNEICQIESDPSLQDNTIKLHDAYSGLEAPWVIKAMLECARSDTVVTLNAPAEFLTRGASALNRFLVGQLHRAGRFELLPGKVVDVQPHSDEVRVVFDDKISETFYRVVRRHGPKSALLEHFPLIASALESERTLQKNKPTFMDQTRYPLWDEGCFGPEQCDVPDLDAEVPRSKTMSVSSDDVPPSTISERNIHALTPKNESKPSAPQDITSVVALLPPPPQVAESLEPRREPTLSDGRYKRLGLAIIVIAAVAAGSARLAMRVTAPPFPDAFMPIPPADAAFNDAANDAARSDASFPPDADSGIVPPDSYVQPKLPSGFIRRTNKEMLPQYMFGTFCYYDGDRGTLCFATNEKCQEGHRISCSDYNQRWCSVMWSRPDTGGENTIVDCYGNSDECEEDRQNLISNFTKRQPELLTKVSLSDRCIYIDL